MNIAWEGGASTSYFERLTRTWGKSKLYLPIIGILDILSIANPFHWILPERLVPEQVTLRDWRELWGRQNYRTWGNFANFRICCWSNSGGLWSILYLQFWFLKTDMWHKEYFLLFYKNLHVNMMFDVYVTIMQLIGLPGKPHNFCFHRTFFEMFLWLKCC